MTDLDIRMLPISKNMTLPCVANADKVLPNILREMETLRNAYLKTTPFQSKHLPALKRLQTQWFALKRPENDSCTVLLCIDPSRRACFLVTSQCKVFLLRLRVNFQCVDPSTSPQNLTVFAVTLSIQARTLFIEDTIVWRGKRLENEIFTERLGFAKKWLECLCVPDGRLMDNIDVKLAQWLQLSYVTPEPGILWELQSNEPGCERLVWAAVASDPKHRTHPTPTPTPTPTPLIALATRGTGPDQWILTTSDKVNLGRGLIKKIALSAKLRLHTSNTVRVVVIWAPMFNKWEIVSCSIPEDPISNSTQFVVPK